jgi:glyoxylase-like metal-dependent hydrolase (beta-lactamase superfamily II)/rhodanese-related sulfurtransferase
LYFKQFLHDDTGCSSYLVASRSSREAAVIDPQSDIEPYVELAAARGYTIVHVFDTHLHADHLSGNRRLAAAAGARLWLHESAEVQFPFAVLHDGDEVHVGQVVLKVIHTPGHRPEAVSLLVINPARSPEPSMLLSGDTLFVGDVGRPDFGGPEGGEQQFRSTHRLLDLPDWVEVFPAHFEGACGKGMCGRPSSTIGFERRFNPMLRLPRAKFVRVTTEPSPRPLNMTAILASNRGFAEPEWLRIAPRRDVPTVTSDEAARRLRSRDMRVLDVREPWEYIVGHISGAICVPQADIGSHLPALPRNAELLVACRSGARSLQSASFLKALGYHVTNLEGGMLGWMQAGYSVVAD